MRRRRPLVAYVDTQRLLSYRAEEWASEADWWAAREAWQDAGGVVPLTTAEDVERAAAWAWHAGMNTYADPEDWRAALHAWEDVHGRLLFGPDAPFEPTGRGMYDHRTGTWGGAL